MTLNRRHIILGMAIALMAAPAAHANPKSTWDGSPLKQSKLTHSFAAPSANLPLWAQRRISASEAKSIALRRAGGGEVVDISRNGDTYRVRVIRKDGRVVDVLIDANTGRVKR